MKYKTENPSGVYLKVEPWSRDSFKSFQFNTRFIAWWQFNLMAIQLGGNSTWWQFNLVAMQEERRCEWDTVVVVHCVGGGVLLITIMITFTTISMPS